VGAPLAGLTQVKVRKRASIKTAFTTTLMRNPMQLPHDFKRIRLHLARSKEFPSGSAQHGYEFVAPLDGKGHIDVHLWGKHREHCRVRRFWNGTEQIGRVVHKPGGAEHARWVFDYDPNRTDDDESGYRAGHAHLRAGGVCLDQRRGGRVAHLSRG